MAVSARALQNVTLDDKYTLESGRVFLTGTQALVRLPMMQRQRDVAAGLNTASFISGYRGSPLGGLDQAMWRAKPFLKRNHIHFQAGINEDLAATMVWGSQQVNLFPGAKYDGVFSMWYGKGPGVDRCGDVFKHGNAAGASRHGGVLLLAGDDHAAKSSTLPHQSEHEFISAMIPVLNPSGVQEFIDFGLYGWAMSRYSGCWIGFICTGETVDSSASVYVDPHRVQIATPNDFEMPEGGLNIRWPDHWTEQEYRLQRYKAYAALAFARANRLDKIVIDSPKPRFGIVTTGKSYLDVRQALDDLGIDEALAAEIGVRLYKVAMSWPLEREGARHFAEGLQEVLVVEEKRAIIENQFRPRVVGKFDEKGQWILPSADELTPAQIARVIAKRLEPFYTSDRIKERLAFLEAKERALSEPRPTFKRVPYFCSGCPHNTSTRVPEGSRALAGIGCHFMALWMDRNTDTFTQMGGEGATWLGQAPFTETSHVFQNLGDGTYYHSGTLAIRAAVSSGANMTYKILYKDLREIKGVSVLIYDQTCAAEKRRRRKRGTFPDPQKRAFINEAVCEGCGDCSVASNCLSVIPVETEFGRKRAIDQSSCNKDFSCVNGFCPSFVTVHGGKVRKRKSAAVASDPFARLPEPVLPKTAEPYNILVTGVGGTGVVTVGALVGMAAHIEGKGCTILDMAGLAQKGGAVLSHIRIAERPEDIHAVRIAAGEAHLLLGCDLVVAAGAEALDRLRAGLTYAIVNGHETPTGEFTRKPDLQFPTAQLRDAIAHAVGKNAAEFVDGTGLATALMGDSIATNLFMLGYAWQKGLVPVSRAAIERAIELNEVAIEANKRSFNWGRLAAVDLPAVARAAAPKADLPAHHLSKTFDEIVARRTDELARYQDAAYARRYQDLVRRIEAAEKSRAPGLSGLAAAGARYAYKLMAYKDEYEVARLYTDGTFLKALAEQFEGDYRLEFNLAPPIIAERDSDTGRLKKRTFGPWMLRAFRLLARFKFLRGTALDIFGRTAERKTERQLIADYFALVEEVAAKLTPGNHAIAVELAEIPEHIRGYGHVKDEHLKRAKAREAELLAAFRAPSPAPVAQAAE
ncbi:MAG: indolepyruvate ferredoxin oxidoreductase family protein [Rhodospirillales bacterium]|nr:indolepyruvate ferredoxin oxidoreductase family protein [Rhodospirillales bacterium]